MGPNFKSKAEATRTVLMSSARWQPHAGASVQAWNRWNPLLLVFTYYAQSNLPSRRIRDREGQELHTSFIVMNFIWLSTIPRRWSAG